MKKTVLGLAAGLFVLAAALYASTGMACSSYQSLGAVDPSGTTVVSVQSPSSPLHYTSTDRIYLDSNRVWDVKDIRYNIGEPMTAGKGVKETSRLFCFDSISRFCANAY